MDISNEKPITQKPRLNTLYFYLTNDCNLRCRHCWISPKYSPSEVSLSSLPFELYCSIIKEAQPLGLAGVKLTGGEPLFHPRIQDILDFTLKENLGLIIETNGVLCTSELAKKIAEFKQVYISVSLDGVNAETHEWVRGINGCFGKTLQGIKNLVDAGLGPKLQIIMTLMPRNVDQMEDMVKLAESMGVGSVKFNLIQPAVRGKIMVEQGETLSIEEYIKLGEWVENVLSPLYRNIKIYYSHPFAFRPLSKMYGSSGSGCATCGIKSIMGVLADGTYALCGIGENVPELTYGRAPFDKLEDVWNNSKVMNELRGHLPARLEGICSICLMKNLCLGFCIAENYNRSNNLWVPFWFCEEAYKKGLFPNNRLLTK
jgi:SynChlorMet cassette radical SAM/SPASM protein ScmF